MVKFENSLMERAREWLTTLGRELKPQIVLTLKACVSLFFCL